MIGMNGTRSTRSGGEVVGRYLAAAVLAASLGLVRGAPGPEAEEALFDGKSLAGWKVTAFGGEGEVKVVDGRIVLEMGASDLTGITRTAPVPTIDYDVSLEGMRLQGSDFFCCLTFPYKSSFCSLVVGGWGGTVVGISSFDGLNASENETTKMMTFDNDRWYRIRVRVTDNHIEAWIDDQQVVDVEPGERRVETHPAIRQSEPFGLAAWNTKAALRNIRLRRLGVATAAPGGGK